MIEFLKHLCGGLVMVAIVFVAVTVAYLVVYGGTTLAMKIFEGLGVWING